MSIITPAWYDAPWASAQQLSELTRAAMAQGFPSGLAQRPTRQQLNRAIEFATNGVLYYMRTGLPNWIAEAQYAIGSVCWFQNRFYRSNTSQRGVEPIVNGNAWELLFWRVLEMEGFYVPRHDHGFLMWSVGDVRYYPRAEMDATFITPAQMAAQFAPASSLVPLLRRDLGTTLFLTRDAADARYALAADTVPGLQAYLRMNAAGPAVGNFVATDAPTYTGHIRSWLNFRTTDGEPDLSGLVDPAPVDVYRGFIYQNNSWEPNVWMQLEPNTTYRVRYHLWGYGYWPQTLTQNSPTGLLLATLGSQPPQIADFKLTTGADGVLMVVCQSASNVPAISGVEILQAHFDWTLPLLSRETASQIFVSASSDRWLSESAGRSTFLTQEQAQQTLQTKADAAISVYDPTKTYRAGVLVVEPVDTTWQVLASAQNPNAVTIDTTEANLLIVVLGHESVAAISDSQNNDWTRAVTNGVLTVFYCIRPTISAQHVFTRTSGSFATMVVVAFKTPHLIDFDQMTTARNTTTGASITLPAITPKSNNLVVTAATNYSPIASVDSEFATIIATVGGYNTHVAYRIAANTSPISPTWTMTPNPPYNAAAIFSFKSVLSPLTIYRSLAANNTGNSLSDTAWWSPWQIPVNRERDARLLDARIYQTPGSYTLSLADLPILGEQTQGVMMKFRVKGAGGRSVRDYPHGAGESPTLEVVTEMKASDLPMTLTVGAGAVHQASGIVDANYQQGPEIDAPHMYFASGYGLDAWAQPGASASMVFTNPRFNLLTRRVIRGAEGRWGDGNRGGDGGGVHGASGVRITDIPKNALYGCGAGGFPLPRVFSINAGGPAMGDFTEDAGFSDSMTTYHENYVDTSGITRPAPMALYQSCRYAANHLTFYVNASVPSWQHYRVRMHFCDGWSQVAGQRFVNVWIGGRRYLTDFDIVGTVGYSVPIVKDFHIATDSNVLTCQFETPGQSLADALINGIQVELTNRWAIAFGTRSIYDWMNDNSSWLYLQTETQFIEDWMSGGVDLTKTANPAPEAVYKSCRFWDNFSLLIPALPNTRYLVRVHTANDYSDRSFNVYINGVRVGSDVRPLQLVGQNAALALDYETQTDLTARILIAFETVAVNTVICGIEVIRLRDSFGGDGFIEVYSPKPQTDWKLLGWRTYGNTLVAMNTTGADLLVVVLGNHYQSLDINDSENNTWTLASAMGFAPSLVVAYCINPKTSAEHFFSTTQIHPVNLVYAFKSASIVVLDQVSGLSLGQDAVTVQIPERQIAPKSLVITAAGSYFAPVGVDSDFLTQVGVGSYQLTGGFRIMPSGGALAPTWTMTANPYGRPQNAAMLSFIETAWRFISSGYGYTSARTATLDTRGATLLVACMTAYQYYSFTVNDDQGNEWVEAIRTDPDRAWAGGAILYCINPKTSATHRIGFEVSGWATFVVMAFRTADEIELNVTAQNYNAAEATTNQLPAIVPAPSDLIITHAGSRGGGNITAVDSGFTIPRRETLTPATMPGTWFTLGAAYRAIHPSIAPASLAPTWTAEVTDAGNFSLRSLLASFRVKR